MAVFGVLIALIVYLAVFRHKTPEAASPIEQRICIRQPVDEGGSLQMGELLTNVLRTEDTLEVNHPDWVDEEGQPYSAIVPIDKEQPLRFLDADKNVNELWILAHRGEEMEVVSASSLVNKLPARFDPLPANPRKVGRFYVGWPFGKQGGLSSLIQSTTGKLLAFGACGLIFYLLGIVTAAGGHIQFR
jgi:hypothetical protein